MIFGTISIWVLNDKLLLMRNKMKSFFLKATEVLTGRSEDVILKSIVNNSSKKRQSFKNF